MSRAVGQYITYSNSPTTGSVGVYQSLFGPISQCLRAVAPRTSDVGQTNPATLNTATSSMEVFAFSDALQATKPIFVRLDYNVTSTPTISFNIGTISNGSGGLTGITTAQTTLLSNQTTGYASGVARSVYAASGDGSFLTLLLNIQTTAVNNLPDALAGFVIERTRDADGTPNGNGFTIWRWSNTADTGASATTSYFAGVQSRIYDTSGNVTQPNSTSWDINAVVPNYANASATAPTTYANDIAQAYPVFTYAGPQPQGASKALAVAYAADVPRAGVVSMTQYGTPGTWLAMGTSSLNLIPYMTSATANAATTRNSQYTALSPVFRWE